MSPADFGTTLTDREFEVLRTYRDTWSMRETGHRLGISETTVRNHLTNIRSRLGVARTAEAVLKLLA